MLMIRQKRDGVLISGDAVVMTVLVITGARVTLGIRPPVEASTLRPGVVA